MLKQRKPLMFQIDSFNSDKNKVERNKILISNPLAGSFKVSNGKFLCGVTINELGVEVRCYDKFGKMEKLKTKDISS